MLFVLIEFVKWKEAGETPGSWDINVCDSGRGLAPRGFGLLPGNKKKK